jgi:hypothetical protein
VFAPLVPLLPAVALPLMWLNSWLYKYNLMFRDISVIENGGVSSYDHASLITVQANAFPVPMELSYQSSSRLFIIDAGDNIVECVLVAVR